MHDQAVDFKTEARRCFDRRFHLIQSTFPTSRNVGGIHAFSPATRFCLYKDRMPCSKKKKAIPKTYSIGQLTCSVQDEDARTLDVELRAVPPTLGPKRHIATNRLLLHSFKSPDRASLIFILHPANIGKHAIVWPTKAAAQQVDGGRDRLAWCLQVQSGNRHLQES